MQHGHIYIIDDDEAMLSLLEEYFSGMGYAVSTFRSAQRAVEALEAFDPGHVGAVISDVNMPIMGGLDLLKWVKEKCPIPVILISAFGSSELEKQALEEGAHSLIKKPFSLAYLKKAVDEAFDKDTA